MSPEDQKMFDDYFDLFAREGWERLEKDLETNLKEVETIHGVNSLEELYKRKGKLEALHNLVTFRSTVELLYEEMIDAPEDI